MRFATKLGRQTPYGLLLRTLAVGSFTSLAFSCHVARGSNDRRRFRFISRRPARRVASGAEWPVSLTISCAGRYFLARLRPRRPESNRARRLGANEFSEKDAGHRRDEARQAEDSSF